MDDGAARHESLGALGHAGFRPTHLPDYEHTFVRPKNPRLIKEHDKARQLRYLGASVKQIAAYLEVSQSSVSVWVRDIELLPRHRAANLKRASSLRSAGWEERCRGRRRQDQQEGREHARRGDPLHAAGCMLYWAEGSKERNTVVFVNSDPAMMEMFTRFLRTCFSLTSEDLTFRLNVYTNNGMDIDEVEFFWMELLGLSRRSARKHVVNHFPTSSSGKRTRKLPYGVCSLKVKRSTRIVQHIYGAIQEYSGIEQPGWLDGPPRKAASAP